MQVKLRANVFWNARYFVRLFLYFHASRVQEWGGHWLSKQKLSFGQQKADGLSHANPLTHEVSYFDVSEAMRTAMRPSSRELRRSSSAPESWSWSEPRILHHKEILPPGFHRCENGSFEPALAMHRNALVRF